MEITNHILSCLLPNLQNCDRPNLDVELLADCVNQCLIAGSPQSSEETQSIKEIVHAKQEGADDIDCLYTLLQQEERETTDKIINAVGGLSVFCKLPMLPWQKELWPADMSASLMRVTKPNERFSLALKTEYTQDGVKHVDAVSIDQHDDERNWSIRSRNDHPFATKSLVMKILDRSGIVHVSELNIKDLHDLAHGKAISSLKDGEPVKVQLYQKA